MILRLIEVDDTDYGSVTRVEIGAGTTVAQVSALDDDGTLVSGRWDPSMNRRIEVEINGRTVVIPWENSSPVRGIHPPRPAQGAPA